MRLNQITGMVFVLIGSILVFIGAPNVDAKDRPGAYIVGGVFMLIGAWRFFAPKGH